MPRTGLFRARLARRLPTRIALASIALASIATVAVACGSDGAGGIR